MSFCLTCALLSGIRVASSELTNANVRERATSTIQSTTRACDKGGTGVLALTRAQRGDGVPCRTIWEARDGESQQLLERWLGKCGLQRRDCGDERERHLFH